MSTDLSIILTRSVKSFGFKIIYRVSSLSNIGKGLDLLKKYLDGTMLTTIVAQKAHKGLPGECNKFGIVENLKRMKAKLYFAFINKIVCVIDGGKIVNETDQSFDGAVGSRKKMKDTLSKAESPDVEFLRYIPICVCRQSICAFEQAAYLKRT